MRRDTLNYALVGAVVVAAAVLLLLALALIGGRSVASADYTVRYRNVTGLRAGAPVFYEGYRIGAVADVTPERDAAGTRYRVTLAVRRDWPIPRDSRARLQSSGLLADVSIGIHEGASHQMLKPGGEIAGVEGGNMFAAMNDLALELGELTRTRIAPLIEVLTRRTDSIGAALDAHAPELLSTAQALLDRLNRAGDALNDVLNPANRAALAGTLRESQEGLAELRATRANLDRALGEITGIAAENRADVRRAVRDLTGVLDTLSSRVDVIIHHLEASSRNLDQFSREIRRRPNRLLLSPEADPREDLE
ncbi:MlaD family protein [Dokdonella sp.]|uniref:MlaD family protein n=1 Tax=Dokdonella sp. TaxID=2291710 RepID=UPI0031C40DBE|nr:MlaD family protein [Dokdonella sp.]